MFDLVACETDPGAPISNSDFKLYIPGGGESNKNAKLEMSIKNKMMNQNFIRILTCSFSIRARYLKSITCI